LYLNILFESVYKCGIVHYGRALPCEDTGLFFCEYVNFYKLKTIKKLVVS